jgi:hypothetical protein
MAAFILGLGTKCYRDAIPIPSPTAIEADISFDCRQANPLSLLLTYPVC